jgi:tetratricopeptide (TPR) repeat protein
MTRWSKIWTHRVLGAFAILASLSLPALATEHPIILSVSPNSARTSPGTKVKVLGTGFSPDDVVYFDGLESRDTKFISSTELDVETPYLRPGTHLLQISSEGASVRSDVEFSALPSEVDSRIDRAIEIAAQGKTDEAASALEQIGETNSDYQVRSAAYYAESQIYFNRGDFVLWEATSALIYLDSDKSGRAVQTFWRYGLAFAQSSYLLNSEPKVGFDLRLADQLVEFDVTQDPEPRFYRALLNARYGNLRQAKADSDFVSNAWSNKPSAAALAAYVAALGGNTGPLRAITSGPIPTDATSLALLGEGFFISGDAASANRFWILAGEANPAGATMALLAARKHLNSGQKKMARVLFEECAAMAPNSKEARDARDALLNLKE